MASISENNRYSESDQVKFLLKGVSIDWPGSAPSFIKQNVTDRTSWSASPPGVEVSLMRWVSPVLPDVGSFPFQTPGSIPWERKLESARQND